MSEKKEQESASTGSVDQKAVEGVRIGHTPVYFSGSDEDFEVEKKERRRREKTARLYEEIAFIQSIVMTPVQNDPAATSSIPLIDVTVGNRAKKVMNDKITAFLNYLESAE